MDSHKRLLHIYISLLIVLMPVMLFGQSITGCVTDHDKMPVPYATIILLQPLDSMVVESDMSDEDGHFSLPCRLDSAIVRVSCVGYGTVSKIVYRDEQEINIQLSHDNLTLREVVVNGENRYSVRRTATGEIYYLSDYAKKSGDPYRALKEIPSLVVNEAFQTVKMSDGSSPMVLIDGRSVNSGITPINPKEIESVEVRDVVSARYLNKGVSHILNIRLKKKSKPYQFVQLATRHDIPFRESMGVGYFEIGSPQKSLYGRLSGNVMRHDDGEFQTLQEDMGIKKQIDGEWRENNDYEIAELLFKLSPHEKTFLAAHVYGKWMNQDKKSTGEGIQQTQDRVDYLKSISLSDDRSYILTSSLYFQHEFSKEKNLEATLAYNLNGDKDKGSSEENYTSMAEHYESRYRFHNRRSSASLDANYSAIWNSVNSLNIGSETRFLYDEIDNVGELLPTYRHRSWNEYLYASFSSQMGELRYMLSAGIEAMWLKSGEVKNHYVRPKLSASVSYSFNANHSARVRYVQSNTSPSIGQLNPYNISTDPLVVLKGNPLLTPEEDHAFGFTYTYNYKSLYLSGFSNYGFSTDEIVPDGYSSEGVFVSTFKNGGRHSGLSIGTQLNYNFPKRLGNAYLMISRNWNYFTGQSAKASFSVSGGIWLNYKKWTAGGDISYRNYVYTPISRTREVTPGYLQLQVNYNITKYFYIAIGLPYFIGTKTTETETYSGTYTSFARQRMTAMSGRPWILFRYTFRKNDKQKIKLGKVVESKEKGISLENR